MEEAALILGIEACLADHARFAADRVGTDGKAWFSVDALWSLDFALGHWNK